MIRLQNNYAITSNSGSFALITFTKGKDKEGNEIDVQKPISYHTTLESALQSYSNNRMADLVSNVDLDLKQVKQAINELREELTIYAKLVQRNFKSKRCKREFNKICFRRVKPSYIFRTRCRTVKDR